MSELGLRFLGVGNAQAQDLGSSAAVFETAEQPLLLIDCGPMTLAAYRGIYCDEPSSLFITHAHLDHIGGLEGLFYRLATAEAPRAPVTLFVPVALITVLQRRLADYPSLLAEGGSNFWDVFQLIPVSEGFWHHGLYFSVFPVRHHEHLTAFGLALEGVFVFTGDTRPIPEVLNRYARRGEWVFHDCGLVSNPSHCSVDELRAEYSAEQCQRMVLYHYESEQTGEQIERAGWRIARRGERFSLAPCMPKIRPRAELARVRRLPDAVGW
ncbi:MBL fold metallo-hydrolase [Halochromatium sp.]